jgi:hypothetical protein
LVYELFDFLVGEPVGFRDFGKWAGFGNFFVFYSPSRPLFFDRFFGEAGFDDAVCVCHGGFPEGRWEFGGGRR